MTLDLAIRLDPDGEAGLRLTLEDAFGRRTVLRPLPALEPEQLEALRRGESLEQTAGALADQISGWFFGKELAQRLGRSLDGLTPLRFVFKIHRDLVAILGDLPVELVRMPPQGLVPLVLHPRVTALVRVPPFVPVQASSEARDWPFRVLIVRTNPKDLGGAVPEAMPIVEEIREAAQDRGLPEGAVEIVLVSSEIDGAELATWARFREALGTGAFDLCVYLGHGDLQEVPDAPPVGQLQFEAANGKESINARRIAIELAQHPVRVVVLAGCLTAAGGAVDSETAGQREELGKKLPKYLRGAQGVAQAIVGDAPVELAVGMRDLLEVNDASLLIGSFFRNLIRDHPGDVEKAIREARGDLFGRGEFPPSWSSAIVFTKGGAAPVFDFMKEDPAQTAFLAARQKDFEPVRVFRQSMAKLFLEAVGDRSPFLAALAIAAEMDKAAAKGDPMVRPRFVQAATGPVTIPVELVGSLEAHRVTGKVTISSESVTIDRLRVDPRLPAANFMFLQDTDGSKANFSIDADSPGDLPLGPGPLFTIEATIGGTAPAVHEVVVTRAKCEPETIVWSGMDVIAVVS